MTEGDEACWGLDTADATLKVNYMYSIHLTVAGALPVLYIHLLVLYIYIYMFKALVYYYI